MRVLLVTAVEAERAAVAAGGPHLAVLAGGVGPAASAAATSAALAAARYDLVVSAGIGGGFAPLRTGELAVAATIAFADLGVEAPDGVEPLEPATDRYQVPGRLAVALADRTGGHLGTVLTVATVTATATRADRLLRRFPDAVAEGMEGAGVAAAAVAHGVPFAELRAISNPVGPRDRAAWRIPDALAALARAARAMSGGWTS